MSFLAKLLKFLDAKMTTPTSYGWFHLMWLAIAIGSGVLLCYLYKKGIIKNVKGVMLALYITLIILEIYKISNFSFSYEDGVSFNFAWYIFPWQFCSTPMYIGLVAALTKGKVHDFCCSFLATFAVFAGLAVMIYPEDVFIPTIGINVQTMICHGSMITMGIFLYYTNHVKAEFKTLFKGISVFSICVAIAIALNEIAHVIGITEDHYFNMFYISRHEDPHLPVYSSVQAVVPYPFSLIIYIMGFSVAACLMLLGAMGIKKLGAKFKKKEN